MTTHTLKCWPEFFAAVEDGSKPFEIRRNDRDYRVGDELDLREYDNDTDTYTGRTCRVVVTYMTARREFVLPGSVVMGIRLKDRL